MKKLSVLFVCSLIATMASAHSKIQNVVVIFTDDQGYEDLSSFGSQKAYTPNIDKMADEGMKLTSFYVASSVCSPSRAALLTGRMPVRAGVPKVLLPDSDNRNGAGLPKGEITIAELLKQKHYATALIGKWHLGREKGYLPLDQGFDYYYGLPYSNNMSITQGLDVSSDIVFNQGYNHVKMDKDIQQLEKKLTKTLKNKPPLMRGYDIIEYPTDQTTLTERYTHEAVSFIKQNKDKPFFLYFAHSFPHVPIFAGEKFKGSSKGGPFYDAVQEIDWSVGEVMKTLKAQGLDKNTLVIFTSDNGPNSKGSAKPLKGRKFNTYEGGVRVPAVIWAPSEIKAGTVTNEIVSALDLFPTIANYAGIAMPEDRIYDGMDLSSFLNGSVDKSPRNEVFYYSANTETIDGVRQGDWKFLYNGYHVRKPERAKGDDLVDKLYNLATDVGEQKNLITKYPEKAKTLIQRMNTFDAALKQDVNSSKLD
ncbi:sulfatase family protein [Thalassotalea sp. PLHSN55]|uniref:sulfatase family protein n=1 Tax=Thalassotalea sp. PLHSN55 TaxID=3435888 RepID=UPI003F85AE21